jgi:predicted metal-binding membrane protein
MNRELLFVTVSVGSLFHIALIAVAARAFLRTRNWGFVLVAFAVAVWPFVWRAALVPATEALVLYFDPGATRAERATPTHSLRMIVQYAALAWALILLARPLHRGRRA